MSRKAPRSVVPRQPRQRSVKAVECAVESNGTTASRMMARGDQDCRDHAEAKARQGCLSAVNAACARPGVPWLRSPDGAVSGRNGQACCSTPSGASSRTRPPGGASATSWVTSRPGIPAAAIWSKTKFPHGRPKLAVELVEGFIQQHGIRLRQERPHQRHTGTLSARKRTAAGVARNPSSQSVPGHVHPRLAKPPTAARAACRRAGSRRRSVGEEKVVLEQAADAAALPAAGRPESCRSGGWCRRRRTGSRGRPR